jgi:putative oxidoreductase
MTTKIQIGARIVLGLIYFVFGGMGLAIAFGFMPMPEHSMPPAATEFMKGIMGSGYFLPFLKITETTCGFLLLIGFMAPLALVILAPITLNITLFHANLTPGMQNLVLPSIMVLAHIVAMSAYWSVYKPLFSNRKKV